MAETPHRVTPSSFDVNGAITYALDRLRRELSPALTYHSVWHTEGDVLPAARRLAHLANVSPMDAMLLEVAAAYHDIGHIIDSHGHEARGVEIATSVLPQFGFGNDHIARIRGLIMATRMPQSPANDLERLMADADLDGLGRDDYPETSRALWHELEAMGKPQTWAQWLLVQRHFLNAHHYFTATARALRDEGKQRNIALVEKWIAEAADSKHYPP